MRTSDAEERRRGRWQCLGETRTSVTVGGSPWRLPHPSHLTWPLIRVDLTKTQKHQTRTWPKENKPTMYTQPRHTLIRSGLCFPNTQMGHWNGFPNRLCQLVRIFTVKLVSWWQSEEYPVQSVVGRIGQERWHLGVYHTSTECDHGKDVQGITCDTKDLEKLTANLLREAENKTTDDLVNTPKNTVLGQDVTHARHTVPYIESQHHVCVHHREGDYSHTCISWESFQSWTECNLDRSKLQICTLLDPRFKNYDMWPPHKYV